MSSGVLPLPTYGVVPTGFNRKSFNTILLELENAMVQEFGSNVIQTPQSPFGQINGLMADLITSLWEYAEDVYQSYDVEQATGTRLDGLATLRLMNRAADENGMPENDMDFRRAITNSGRARVDVADLTRALLGLEGVTYVQVWVPDQAETVEQRIPPGYVSVAIIGGDPDDIAEVMRRYIVPGISTYGNEVISATLRGLCRSMYILRPILIPVILDVSVAARRDDMGCPPPSLVAIRDTIASMKLKNGEDITYFKIRSTVEREYPNVEVVGFEGKREDISFGYNGAVVIGFIELATLDPKDITVNSVPTPTTATAPPFYPEPSLT